MSSMPISRSLLLYSPHRAVFLTTRPRARRAQQRTTPRFRGVAASPLPDSNRSPPPYHGGALPTELRGRVREDGSRDAGPRGIRRLSRAPHLVPPRRRPRLGHTAARAARRAGVDAQLF